MANGKVVTGFSKPYVALYDSNNGNPQYTSGQVLARGVSASVESTSGNGVNFYADNVNAESTGGIFTGATLTLVVDGLKDAARKLIMGLPNAEPITVGTSSVDVYSYDDRQVIPYVGIGFIVRYMEAGVTTYAPIFFPKAAFSVEGLEAETQEEEISFQTTKLSATLMRDDSTNHAWRKIAVDQTSETAAEDVLKAFMNIGA